MPILPSAASPSDVAGAIDAIESGSTVAIGGYYDFRHPMALVRELMRSGKKDLTVIAPSGSIDVDLLIGAGMVKRLIGGRVAFGMLGLAPNFRRGLEAGTVEFLETDTLSMVRGFQAAYRDVPYVLTRTLIGSDLLKYYPAEVERVGDESYLKVFPLRPDVCLVHVQQSDRAGNLQLRSEGFDVEMIKAAVHTIASVEEIVASRRMEDSNSVTVPKYYRGSIQHVIEVPYGAHPTSCVPYYVHDVRHHLDYLEAVEDGRFSQYVETFVSDTGRSMHDYLSAIGGTSTLWNLTALARRGVEMAEDGHGFRLA